MVTFAEFIENAASKREFVNILFEERVFELIGTLQELVVAPEAELDIAEAYAWNEGRGAGSNEEFPSAVDACSKASGADLICTERFTRLPGSLHGTAQVARPAIPPKIANLCLENSLVFGL